MTLTGSPRYKHCTEPKCARHPARTRTRPVLILFADTLGANPRFWAKDGQSRATKMINARAETIAEQPAFREPLLSRPLLIPADGFYEWGENTAREVLPSALLSRTTQSLRSLDLGPMEEPRAGTRRKRVQSLRLSAKCTSVDIHDRVPVILKEVNHDRWLGSGVSNSR